MSFENFWRFSLNFYREADVQTASLGLQNDHDCDVVITFFCIWLALTETMLRDGAFDKAVSFSKEWSRRAIRPLRAVRVDLRSGVEGVNSYGFREALKELELTAEKAQHEALEKLTITTARSAHFNAERREEFSARVRASELFDRYATSLGLSVRSDAHAFQLLLDRMSGLDGASFVT